jgi:hypothetical protein
VVAVTWTGSEAALLALTNEYSLAGSGMYEPQAPNQPLWADLHLILAAERDWEMLEPANQRKAGHAELDYVNP